MGDMAKTHYLPEFASLSPGLRLGRSVRDGYVRGWGIQFGQLRDFTPNLIERYADTLLGLIEIAQQEPKELWPETENHRRPSMQQEATADMVNAVIRIKALEHSITPQLLATRDHIHQLLGGERQYPAEPFLGQGFEQLLTNTPASRLLSTARTLTDVRKLGPEMAAEMLTGLRLTDVSKQQQERILRERLAAAMKQAGAPQFSSIRFTRDQIANAEPDEAEQMRLFNSLANQLQSQQAKARAARKGEQKIRRRPVSVVQ